MLKDMRRKSDCYISDREVMSDGRDHTCVRTKRRFNNNKRIRRVNFRFSQQHQSKIPIKFNYIYNY